MTKTGEGDEVAFEILVQRYQTPDRDALGTKEKEILALHSKIQEEATNFRLEIRKILTAEQQAQFGAFGPRMKFPPGPRGGLEWGNPGPERMPEKERE
jgi:hypothetical protein